jgi:hypothetical protein
LLFAVTVDHLALDVRHDRGMGLAKGRWNELLSSSLLLSTRPLGTHLVLHGELSLALGHSTQLARVAKHVVQGDLGGESELVVPDLGVDDRTLALVEGANDVA